MYENNYYSANEKTGKLKIFISCLWILLAVCLVAGGIFTYSYIKALEKDNSVKSDSSKATDKNVNVLVCVVDEDNEEIAPQFLLINFDFDVSTISVTEMPTNVKLTGAEKSDTAQKLFNYGSARYVRDAVVNNYGIKVQRFLKCSMTEVEQFVDSLGGIDYNIPQKMQQENADGNLVTNLVKGKQKLNGNQYCQYLRFDWGNAEKTADKREDLLVSLLNEYCPILDSENILKIYKKVANNIETDISIVEMNDFSLKFEKFTKVENPAAKTDIDFKDKDVTKVKLEKFYN